jgi:mRNA interferase MazF
MTAKRFDVWLANLEIKEDCDIMIDQLRAIDNKKLIKKIGALPKEISLRVIEKIKVVLYLEN